MLKTRLLPIFLLLALVAACSPADEGAEAPDDVEATTPSGDNGAGDSDGDDGGFTPTQVCIEAAQAMSAAMQSYSSSFSGALDEATAAEVEDQLEQWADQAPDEIKDDFDVFAREMSAYYEALADIGLIPGATPTAEQLQALSEAADEVDQAALDEASNNIEAWFDGNC
jgi:hypothetical protein